MLLAKCEPLYAAHDHVKSNMHNNEEMVINYVLVVLIFKERLSEDSVGQRRN